MQHCSAIDLNILLNPVPGATYLLRVSGHSMTQAGILDGDILLVDRSVELREGDIVVAEVNQAFTVKYLFTSPEVRLVPANSDHPTIYLSSSEELNLFGVVSSSIHQLRTHNMA